MYKMFTGNLIDQLIATVEQAEEHAYKQSRVQDHKLAYFYSVTQHEMLQLETKLAGVA
jgi:hypothetical protein